MTPQEQLRAERRARFYSGGHRERNGTPTTAEALEDARLAREIDAEIDRQRPGLRGAADRSRAAAALELRVRRLALLG